MYSTAGIPIEYVTEHAQIVRDKVANLLSAKRSYERQLSGEAPTRLSDATLREDIARVEGLIAKWRAQLPTT
jgi:hypothetical protein